MAKKFTFDFNVEAWIQGLEIEADTYEEAEEKLLSMSLLDIASNGFEKNMEVSDIDYEVEWEPGDNYSTQDIREWLNNRKDENSTITDEEINWMADKIYDIAVEEESYADEPYESVDDIDIPELCDASAGGYDQTKLHNLYYRLIGLEEEDWEEEE